MPNRCEQWRRWFVMLVFNLIVFWPGGARPAEYAAERPLEKITIAYSSMSGNMAPLWITQERGFFRKYGLDVQLVLSRVAAQPCKAWSPKTSPSPRWREQP